MKTPFAAVLAGLSLALPAAAFAQSADTAYCTALSTRYETYAQADNGGRSHNPPPASIATAISRCKSDPASAIPVLEKRLTDDKVTLPPRG